MRSRQYIFKKFVFNIALAGPMYFCFKAISQNQHLDLFFRYFSFYRYISKGARSFSTKLKPICVITGRSRGLVNNFCISRIIFKEYASQGNLYGFRKSQW